MVFLPNISPQLVGGASINKRSPIPTLAGFAVVLVPFVQLGLSYWVAIHVLTAVVVTALLLMLTGEGQRLSSLAVAIALIALAQLSLTFSSQLEPKDILRVEREMLIFGIFILAVPVFSKIGPKLPLPNLISASWFSVAIISVFVLTQFVLIPTRQFITFPYNWFVINTETLPTALDLVHSSIRPSGTFGEPSYLAFVLLTFIVGFHRIIFKPKNRLLLACLLLCMIMSRSLSGYIGTLVVVYFASPQPVRRAFLLVAPVALMCLLLLGWAGFNFSVVDRVASLGSDESAQIRLFLPLQIIPQYLANFPIGAPFGEVHQNIASTLGSYANRLIDYTDNGAFNFLFSYGVVGLLMLIAIIASAPSRVFRAYFVITMFFNGSFLATDKLAIILIAVMLDASVRAHLSARPQAGAAR